MQAFDAIRSRIVTAEYRLAELEKQKEGFDAQLSALRLETEPFNDFLELELLALGLAETSRKPNDDNETQLLAYLLSQAEYQKIIYQTSIASLLFQPLVSGETLEQRLEKVRAHETDAPHKVLFVGAALLQAYVQANWTGPPLACLSDPSKYPLPFMPRESELSGMETAMARLELHAKATSAASAKDRTVADLDPFPRLHAMVADRLEVNGEALVEGARGLHFLEVAVTLIRAAADCVKDSPLTSGWWRARCATVYQESLQSRDVAFDLRQESETNFASCWARLTAPRSELAKPVSKRVLAMLMLERGVSAHKFREATKAKLLFAEALKILDLKVELSGALGKRTKFQIEEKTQLVLLASSERTKAPEKAKAKEIEPSQEGHAAGFGTVVEAGHVKVKIAEVDEDTPLHERIQITPTDSAEFEMQRRGHLDLIDQVAILDLCIDVKNSYAMERLTAEEMLAYCERVTENPDNWTVHGCALLIKSKLEFERWKTKERSVLQMQMLVDQQTNRLTPLQFRQKDIAEDSAPPTERLYYLHSLVWPPVWRLKRGLADRYMEIGVVGSALHLYQELRLWDDAVACLIQMDKRHRAETLVRELLAVQETPSLLVTLAELVEDENLLEKAWVVSNYRYARAKRLLGAKAYDRGEYEKAKTHLHQAVTVNAQFPWAWFRLGAAAMRTEDWLLARKAYARVVSLEPEDPEAWANLSASLVRLGDVEAAFNAIEEACKYGFGNSRIWDSHLTLAISAKKWEAALLAMDTLIDLEGRKAGAPKVDVRALLPLTEHAINTPSFRHRFDQLIAKIKAKCQSQADVWALAAEYFSATGRNDEKRDTLIRRCRALANEPSWNKDSQIVTKLVLTSITLCKAAALAEEPRVKKDTAFFISGFIEKIGDWKQLNFQDDEKKQLLETKMEALLEMVQNLSA